MAQATHYYVDMVFYNKILRAYVLIELKTTKLTPEAAGQINMYLNYYAAEVNDPDDNPPIGKEELGKPFPQEAELQEKSTRLITLNALLNIDGKAISEPEQADEKPSIHDQLKAPGRPGSNQHNTPSQRQEER